MITSLDFPDTDGDNSYRRVALTTPVEGVHGLVFNFLGSGGIDNIVVTPLPAALPLYGSGLAILGLIGWRKRRRVVTAEFVLEQGAKAG